MISVLRKVLSVRGYVNGNHVPPFFLRYIAPWQLAVMKAVGGDGDGDGEGGGLESSPLRQKRGALHARAIKNDRSELVLTKCAKLLPRYNTPIHR